MSGMSERVLFDQIWLIMKYESPNKCSFSQPKLHMAEVIHMC